MICQKGSGSCLSQLSLVFLCVCFSSFGNAANRSTNLGTESGLSIHFVDRQPTVDGDINSDEWFGATRVVLGYETRPAENMPPSVFTEALLMEDGEHLYVAFVAEDPDTTEIRAHYQDHDQLGTDDRVGIVIDTFNNEQRAFEFFVNPLGVQMDAINDDLNGNYNSSWNALWNSAGKINGKNFTVEMSIPLKQLRYAPNKEQQVWKIDLVRYYNRDKSYRVASSPSDRDINCYLCQLEEMQGFGQLRKPRNFELIPSITSGSTEVRDVVAGGDWNKQSDSDAGVDIQWGINQNLFLNATINPDFSQIEADNLEIDINNTFTLFFPERRNFFLEGSDYFNTELNLVHTRNISDPDYGLKLTGENGSNSYGFLTANDTTTSFILPGHSSSDIAFLTGVESEASVFRYQRELANNSSIGWITTDRRGDDYSNTVAGVDGIFRFGNGHRIASHLFQSESKNPESLQTRFGLDESDSGHAFKVMYQFNNRNWDVYTNYQNVAEDFRGDMGFVTRSDYKKVLFGGAYNWVEPGQVFARMRWNSNWDKTWSHDGTVIEEEYETTLDFQNGPNESNFRINYQMRDRLFNNEYFEEHDTNLSTGITLFSDLLFSYNANYGRAVDVANSRIGHFLNHNPFVSYRWGRHVQTSVGYNHRTFDVDGGQLFEVDQINFRFTYQFNRRSFFRVIVQQIETVRNPALYNSVVDRLSKNVARQFLYSYKLNARSSFFLGYSDSGFQDDLLSSVETNAKSVFAKFSYAWQI